MVQTAREKAMDNIYSIIRQSSGEILGAFKSNLIIMEVECSECLCG